MSRVAIEIESFPSLEGFVLSGKQRTLLMPQLPPKRGTFTGYNFTRRLPILLVEEIFYKIF